ncbi:partner of Y14 and mago [Microplitis demolitor]|uniref:partner of Y14 and mago n=1 Tax=Microplitis demolitor TaxID=69319 RepID=UPI0004CDABC5|nr:partner of Y14 and mago [Microplitis demolitor]
MASSYIKDDQGGTFIPASQRPDGTWRKPRRVRDGYVPQEEVPLYESLGKQFQKNKLSYPVGMSAEYVAAHKAKVEADQKRIIPGMVIVNETKKKKKKSKNKSTNALADEVEKMSVTDLTNNVSTIDNKKTNNKSAQKPVSNSSKSPPKSQPSNSSHIDTTSLLSDSMKRLKNLRKKIREIDQLESKIKSGDLKNPDKEIVDKIAKKNDILDEIKLLESNQ